MRYLSSEITYCSLVIVALEASNWESTTKNLSLEYLHHNDTLFSLISIEDNDIKRMFKASGNVINGIHFYVTKGLNDTNDQLEEQTRYMNVVIFFILYKGDHGSPPVDFLVALL